MKAAGITISVRVLRDYGIVIALIAFVIILSLMSPTFFTYRNLYNVVDQWSPITIMAIAGTFVLIAGGFDLSIAGLFVISAVVGAKVSGATSVPLGLMAGLGTGILCGFMNGVISSFGRINAFVATLTTSIIMLGTAAIITKGFLVEVGSPAFGIIGQGAFLGLSYPIWILVVFTLCSSVLLNATVFGRYVFATGGNIEAARLSGVPVRLFKALTYAYSGFGGAMAGLIVASRTQTASADMGSNLQYMVFAAMLLGGNSVLGGEGAIWRTLVGTALLALIGNGFNLVGVDPLYQQIATGLIILFAVGVDAWARWGTGRN